MGGSWERQIRTVRNVRNTLLNQSGTQLDDESLKEGIYLVKRWRRLQYLVNQFWLRLRKEFLCSLQQRQKWTTPRRNMHVGDIVLLSGDNVRRNHWRMGRAGA